jgi:hypothetical protein
MTHPLLATLLPVLATAQVSLPSQWEAAIITHFDGMVAWNRTHNLTRIVSTEDAAVRHYADSLIPLLRFGPPVGGSAVDVGTGAGFPGLLAALVWPDSQVMGIEPAQKRVSFLRTIAPKMGVRFEVGPPGSPQHRATRVLSRATFPDGERAPLAAALLPGAGNDIWQWASTPGTWAQEACMWGTFTTTAEPLSITGLEDRFLLRATATK